MVQCEMCGAETGAPKTIKVEGAELDVCHDCADLGTEVSTSTSTSASSKYSTTSPTGTASESTPSTSSGGSATGTRSGGGGGGGGTDDLFDSLGDLAQDYDERIRTARESRGLSQDELAKELNEKRSLINKLERGEILPNDAIQSKLERHLEIDLSGGTADAEDWSSESGEQSFTLGEMAERRD